MVVIYCMPAFLEFAVPVDYSNACDKIPHSGIIEAAMKFNIPVNAVRWISDFSVFSLTIELLHGAHFAVGFPKEVLLSVH